MLWFASRHPQMPWLPKIIAVVAVAYAFSPIDLIPDFIPILGFIDDAVILPILIWLAVRLRLNKSFLMLNNKLKNG